MPGRLEGKVALITGAARGQGRAHAVRLAQEGADVIGVDVCGPLPHVAYPSATPEDLEESVRQVETLDRRMLSFTVNVRDLEGVRAAVDQGVAELGRLDVIVANAGICVPALWAEITPEMFRDTIDINTVGAWNTVMSGAPHIVRAGGGSIILTSSAAGLKVQPYMVPYTTSKFAVTGMTKAFAAELAKDGVRVNRSTRPGSTRRWAARTCRRGWAPPSRATRDPQLCSRTCFPSRRSSPSTSPMPSFTWSPTRALRHGRHPRHRRRRHAIGRSAQARRQSAGLPLGRAAGTTLVWPRWGRLPDSCRYGDTRKGDVQWDGLTAK